ncbi:MAG: OmpA family protein [Verrucomicrobiota bacterium]|jgi:outer membrane protein OmpA-like peptidoglycan-associated protein|nr:OmpA family protein [Verrucomicrobiota bacterium]
MRTLIKIFSVVVLVVIGGCKSQKPVGLTKIPTMTPIVKTVTVPGPAQPLGGGNPLPGGNPGGGGTGPTIVEIPQDPLNEALGNNFSGNDIEDRDTFLAQMVHFDYDSSSIKPSDLTKVEIVAQHLIQNPTHKLMVEGHCDERGTEDYNISLGERRALAVVDELIRLGINQGRVRTTSYGEKVPMSDGLTEQSFAKNRRGEFVLLKPSN